MKKILLLATILLASTFTVTAQKAETRTAGEANSQATAATRPVALEAGTRLSGELQNSLDVRKAQIGDQVVLRTTKAIKSEGRTVVAKGAKLIGRVTEVAQRSKGSGKSSISVLFDRLESETLNIPIAATLSSVTQGNARISSDDDRMQADTSMSSSSSAGASAGSGSLLGGVSNTVGSVVGGSTAAVGSTVRAATNTAGGAVSHAGRSLRGVRVSQSSNTNVEGGSKISLDGGNLRLEKGTHFNLVLNQSASAGTRNE